MCQSTPHLSHQVLTAVEACKTGQSTGATKVINQIYWNMILYELLQAIMVHPFFIISFELPRVLLPWFCLQRSLLHGYHGYHGYMVVIDCVDFCSSCFSLVGCYTKLFNAVDIWVVSNEYLYSRTISSLIYLYEKRIFTLTKTVNYIKPLGGGEPHVPFSPTFFGEMGMGIDMQSWAKPEKRLQLFLWLK